MVPASIAAKINKGLHNKTNHPLSIVKKLVHSTLPYFSIFEGLDPVVTVTKNFDLLRIPKDHPSRRDSDTYYVDANHVLRTHTSAHQVELLRAGIKEFLVTGDVFRKDDIDAKHYPVFHQMEGVRLIKNPDEDLKTVITNIVNTLFPGKEFRVKPDYFPFTDPSYEVEVRFNDDWLEILGCGVIHPEVLANAGLKDETGWAFGIGLERIAMILFDIPDIRLFWSEDTRFLSQFEEGKITKFKPFSKYPACHKDVSMWIPEGFHQNNLTMIVRDIAGDLVEDVKLIDQFKKDERESRCYRINYRSLDRSLTNEEINEMQNKVRARLTDELGVKIR